MTKAKHALTSPIIIFLKKYQYNSQNFVRKIEKAEFIAYSATKY